MDWETIKKAMHSAVLKTNSGMTLAAFERLAWEVKKQLSHTYLGEFDAACANCGEDFDYEFHTED